jgi:hypothetical protein
MWGQVRAQKLTRAARAQAARQLLAVYGRLAANGTHLLDGLMTDRPPEQWERLPADDAVDRAGLFQWFYHCHAPEDRPGAAEHGHFHLFARRALWEPLACAPAELEFERFAGASPAGAETRHLLGVSLDAKGVPASLFVVDSSVTGDAMMSAVGTLSVLRALALDTGFPDIDRMLESVVRLCEGNLRELFDRRDEALRRRGNCGHDGAELLAEIAVDLDACIEGALRPKRKAPDSPTIRRPTRRPGRAGQPPPRPAPARGETFAVPRGR